MTDVDLTAKKFKRSKIYLGIGALIIFISVLFINKIEYFLSAVTNVEPWFIIAAIVAIVGWVIAFLGIIGIVRNNPNRNNQ